MTLIAGASCIVEERTRPTDSRHVSDRDRDHRGAPGERDHRGDHHADRDRVPADEAGGAPPADRDDGAVRAGTGSPVDLTDEVARRCDRGMAELSDDLDEETTIGPDCFRVTSTIDVEAQVVIEPGSTFVFEDGAGIQVRSDGRLRAEGTPGQEIIFSAEEPIPGYWRGIRYGGTNSTHNVLRNVIIEYAGSGHWRRGRRGGPANLTVHGARLEIEDIVLQHGGAAGLWLHGTPEALTMSGNNVITGNEYPVRTNANSVALLPGDTSYSGNDEDYIRIESGDVSDGGTWDSFNVPLYFDTSPDVEDNHLTIMSNELIFGQDRGLQVRGSASMALSGAADAPVIFRGDEAIPGYWRGLRYGGTNSGQNSIEHVEIRDGGGGNWRRGRRGGPANLTLHGSRVQTLHNLTVDNSADDGIHLRGDPTVSWDCATVHNADGFNSTPPC